MRFDFGVAAEEDDGAIRKLLAENPMPGLVTVAFEREPSYFAGEGVMGDHCLTLKAVERSSGSLAGILSLAVSERFVGGKVRKVGYLGQARIASEFRGYLLPMRSLAFVKSQLSSSWPDTWYCAIVDDNPAAQRIFAGGLRRTFPRLEVVSDIHTLAIPTPDRLASPLRSRRGRDATTTSSAATGKVNLKSGTETGLDDIVAFLQRTAHQREFYPWYRREHFSRDDRTPSSRMPGLREHDFIVAVRGGRIVGTCAAWDQGSFKQTVVHGYQGWLGATRALFNLVAPVVGMKRLPKIGEQISSASLVCLSVLNDDLEVFRLMLQAAIRRAREQEKEYLLAGFSPRDPLLPAAQRHRHIRYRSTMYAFSFEDPNASDGKTGPPPPQFSRHQIPHLEIAAL